MSTSIKSPTPSAVVTFRPDFCSPAYLNSLLRLQHLHWLEIRRGPGPGAEGTIVTFQFVIPSCQSNLMCVLSTEVPLLEAKLACKVRQIPVPDYIAPEGLKAFSVDYAGQKRPGSGLAQMAHLRFLTALRATCVRLQLTRICVDPASGVGGCTACAKIRTHTKSVRGSSAVRPRLRLPVTPLILDLARPRMRRSSSAEAAAAAAATGDSKAKMTELEVAKMTNAAADSLSDGLLLSEAATDAAALLVTAVSEALRVYSGGSCRRRPSRWRQFSVDFCVTSVVADALMVRERLQAGVVCVFADWAAKLSGCLLAGCVFLLADSIATGTVAASQVADAAAGHLLCDVIGELATQMAEAKRLVVQISLPCDWRTSRSLVGLQPVRRLCPNCGASITAEASGLAGYRLTIRSLGRQCLRHASVLQLADYARSSKDASLGALLLQEVAAMPPAW